MHDKKEVWRLVRVVITSGNAHRDEIISYVQSVDDVSQIAMTKDEAIELMRVYYLPADVCEKLQRHVRINTQRSSKERARQLFGDDAPDQNGVYATDAQQDAD
jgi:hypothetical protein